MTRSTAVVEQDPSLPNVQSDARRIQLLFEELGAFTHRVVRQLGTPDRDADDLTQEVFVVAFRGIRTFDGAFPKRWLFQIARRVVAGHRRLHSVQREVLESSPKDEGGATAAAQQDRSVHRRELRSALDVALLTLSDAEREVFLLYELEGMSMRETADVVGCPEQTGYSRLRVARKKMRVSLEELAIRGTK